MAKAKAASIVNATPAAIPDADADGAFYGEGQSEEGGTVPTGTAPVLTQVDHFLEGLVMVSGAIFMYEPKDGELTEDSPTMTGSMQIGDTRRVGVAIWKRVAQDSGVIYSDICVGDRAKSKYHGRMFRNTNNPEGNPTYGGYITLLPVERQNQYSTEEWDAAPKLVIFGIARRNRADGKVRISLTFTDGFVSRGDVPF